MKKYHFEYAPIRKVERKNTFSIRTVLGLSLAALIFLICYFTFWAIDAHLADKSPVSGVLLMAFAIALFFAIREFKNK